ncbi:MAG: V-type ATP synthase subunit K [Planctomycetota bacterium]
MDGLGNALAFLGAALAALLAGSGSSVGIGISGRAAAGVLTEKPERYGLNFMLVVLPGTQGIYGLVVAMMLMNSMGLFTQAYSVSLNVWQGLTMLAACLPVGIAGLVSAIHQGKVCAGGILMAAKRPEMAFKAGAVYAVMVELYALFGMLVSVLLLLMAINWPSVQITAEAAVR